MPQANDVVENAVVSLPAKPKKEGGLLAAFLPNRIISPNIMRLLIGAEAAIFLVIWINSPFKVLPRPFEVLEALKQLWLKGGLGHELLSSFQLNVQALGLTTLISLAFAYLTVLPVMRPIVAAISKARFLSLVGFPLVFTLIFGGGRPLQLGLMVFGMSVFFVTSMSSVVEDIPSDQFDYARTLRMNEWRVVWEVVILGTLDRAFEVMRQNAAIGWLMLTMVEGISRAEGGIGVMLLNENRYQKLPEVFAIQIVFLIVGLFQDSLIGLLRRVVCPYAQLTLERK